MLLLLLRLPLLLLGCTTRGPPRGALLIPAGAPLRWCVCWCLVPALQQEQQRLCLLWCMYSRNVCVFVCGVYTAAVNPKP